MFEKVLNIKNNLSVSQTMVTVTTLVTFTMTTPWGGIS